MNKKGLVAVLSCALLLAVMAGGCKKQEEVKKPSESPEQMQSGQVTEPTQAAQDTQPDQATQPNQETEPTKETQAAQDPQENQETKPDQDAQGGQASKPDQDTKPSQEPQTTKPVQKPEDSESAKPTPKPPATKPDKPEQKPQETQPTEPTEEDFIGNLNVEVVNTPYGNLYYQEQWREFMIPEQVQAGKNLRVCFMAQINQDRYPLFEIIISEENGDAVAQITDANGKKRNVYVIVEEYLEHPELDEGNQRLLYAMQEDINFVIEYIK